jgi:serine/threonine protein kinase
MSEEIESHILKRFEILQKLGKGAYGVVWKAIDKKTQRVIALKKVKYYFFLIIDFRCFSQFNRCLTYLP